MNRRMVSMNDSKSESKKLIPIYLQELFLERTDDRHFLRMPEILSYLETKIFMQTDVQSMLLFSCCVQQVLILRESKKKAVSNTT